MSSSVQFTSKAGTAGVVRQAAKISEFSWVFHINLEIRTR